jgi:hypothetical protein
MNNNNLLLLPRSVADSVDALRLRRAVVGGGVLIPSQAWHRQGFDTLRAGVTRRIQRDRLRDLQRVALALCEWLPSRLDADAEQVLSWSDTELPPLRDLPPLLIRLRSLYDELCDLSALGWIDLVRRVSPDLPQVVVRDWLGLLSLDATDPVVPPEKWFDVLMLSKAVDASALAIAVGDAEFLEKIAHCLITCPHLLPE